MHNWTFTVEPQTRNAGTHTISWATSDKHLAIGVVVWQCAIGGIDVAQAGRHDQGVGMHCQLETRVLDGTSHCQRGQARSEVGQATEGAPLQSE